jgi:hypothetical protein
MHHPPSCHERLIETVARLLLVGEKHVGVAHLNVIGEHSIPRPLIGNGPAKSAQIILAIELRAVEVVRIPTSSGSLT